jgi:hypothetical protein
VVSNGESCERIVQHVSFLLSASPLSIVHPYASPFPPTTWHPWSSSPPFLPSPPPLQPPSNTHQHRHDRPMNPLLPLVRPRHQPCHKPIHQRHAHDHRHRVPQQLCIARLPDRQQHRGDHEIANAPDAHQGELVALDERVGGCGGGGGRGRWGGQGP